MLSAMGEYVRIEGRERPDTHIFDPHTYLLPYYLRTYLSRCCGMPIDEGVERTDSEQGTSTHAKLTISLKPVTMDSQRDHR